MQIEWDERPSRRDTKNWQFYLRFCSVCQQPFKTMFERHTCCPECVAIFKAAMTPELRRVL